MNSHHFAVGNMRLIVLADGVDEYDEKGLADMIKPMPDAFLQAFRALPQPCLFSYNVLYLESGGERILIDTGIGVAGKPQYGNFLDSLQHEGISADQIDKVILSHLHMDHVGGITADGNAVFPNAEIIVPRLEWEYWLEGGREPDERTQVLKAVFQPYSEHIHYLDDGETVAGGITVIALPGHTPGHCGFMLESDGKRLLHIVDALHTPMQIAFPEVSPVFDSQPELSPKTRRKVLEQIADEELLILTYHLPFPGLGHVVRDGTAFAWKPI